MPINTIQNWMAEYNRWTPAAEDVVWQQPINFYCFKFNIVADFIAKPLCTAQLRHLFIAASLKRTFSPLRDRLSVSIEKDNSFNSDNFLCRCFTASTIDNRLHQFSFINYLYVNTQTRQPILAFQDPSADPTRIRPRNFDLHLLNDSLKNLEQRAKVI